MRFASILLAASATALAAAPTALVVDFGAHPSVQAAANSEAEVNWLDDDLRDDTACTECFAALELQRCLRQMTDSPQDFAILDDDAPPAKGNLILLGGPGSNKLSRQWLDKLGVTEAELAALGREGYRLKSGTVEGRQVILIAGASRVGTLYGAYDLLYRLGCRWFAIGELHENLPHVESLGQWDVTERPSFLNRGYYLWEDRGTPELFLWMARNRMNYWWVGQSNHALLRKLGIRILAGFHDAEVQFLDPAAPYPYKHSHWNGNASLPADPYPVSPDFAGDANKDGRLSYFEAHPEWYYFDGAKRTPGMVTGDYHGDNYCTANPRATDEFMKNFVQSFIDGPNRGVELVRFMTLDGGRWCRCKQCEATGTPTDRVLLLEHRFVQDMRKANAAGKIRHLPEIFFIVYSDTLAPPTRSLPADFGQTSSAILAPIGRCYVHNLNEPQCPANANYLRQFAGWATAPDRQFRGPISISEYYNVSKCRCLPVNYMHTMANDIPYYYYQLGARHFEWMHVTTANWGTKALTSYQLARQLWDVKTDCPALWADYFQRRYGPAAETMREFYASLETMLKNVTELKIEFGPRLNRGAADLFPNAHLRYRREPGVPCDAPTLLEMVEHSRTCRKLLGRAMDQAADERLRRRLAEDDQCFTYAERTLGYYHACVEAFQLARAGKRKEAQAFYDEARRLSKVLQADKDSLAHSVARYYSDAFAGTFAPKALGHIAKLLKSGGKVQPQQDLSPPEPPKVLGDDR